MLRKLFSPSIEEVLRQTIQIVSNSKWPKKVIYCYDIDYPHDCL
nr:MAG TPA: hypothetical protein [Caudoviricetes sp.]